MGGEVLAEILWKISKPQFWVGRGEPDDLVGSFQPWQPELMGNREGVPLVGRGTAVCVRVCPWGLRKKYGEVGREQGGHSRIFLAVELEVPDQLAFSVLGKPGC